VANTGREADTKKKQMNTIHSLDKNRHVVRDSA